MHDYSAGHISTAESHRIIATLNEKLANDRFRFHPGVSYRHLFVLKGDAAIRETVPPHDYIDKFVTSFWRCYEESGLKEVMLAAREILSNHPVNIERTKNGLSPANAIWLWGEGKTPDLPSIYEEYGMNGALISAVDLLKGIGVCAGLEIINVPGATGYLDTNYKGKAEAAIAAAREKDLVFVHVEAPDEAGHQGLCRKKVQAIEDFDQKIVQPVWDGLAAAGFDFRLVVAMDHFTPLSLKTHVDKPVPIAIYDSSDDETGSGLKYTEANAAGVNKLLENGKRFFEILTQ